MRIQPGTILLALLAPAVLLSAIPARAVIMDDFESYAPGTFPSPLWSDVGLVQPDPPLPPIPSAYVISTTDAFGRPTQALSTVSQVASVKGIYTSVPVSTTYALSADVRVDQYSDNPQYTTSDWPMQLTFGQVGVANFDYTPQAGIYASSLTRGWRLFLISSNGGPSADIDLSAVAGLGTWYHLDLTLDATTGAFHSRITDIATSSLLSDEINTIAGWDQSDAQFDSFAFFGGDLSDDTVGDVGVVDNINVATRPVPEPAGAVLLALGLLGFVVGRRRRAHADPGQISM